MRATWVDQIRARELAGRDVDRDPDRLAVARPAGGDPAGLGQRPGADRGDLAARLGEPDQGLGVDRAEVRVAPAQQRLDRADPLGLEIQLGLVFEAELVAADRAPRSCFRLCR